MPIIPKGTEPENIKKRINILFAKLDEAYPDKVIRNLQRDHKKWAETVSELYRLLGYSDSDSFLAAYGYRVERAKAGRPSGDSMAVIEELRKRYPNGCEATTISTLEKENPDLKGRLKTLNNTADKLFGMPLKDYLQSIGLLKERDYIQELESLICELKKRYPDENMLPATVAQLKSQNKDLPVEKLVYTAKLGITVKDYLLQPGLLRMSIDKTEEMSNEDYLQLLKQRYADRTTLPANVTELANQNPDIPVRKLNKYLREKGETKAEHYYIRNWILRGKPTDIQEYTLYQVRFLSSGSIYWVFSEVEGPQPGDKVKIWPEPREAVVLQVCTCLGIDAPYPVGNVGYWIKELVIKNSNVLKIGKNPPEKALTKMDFSPGLLTIDPFVEKQKDPINLAEKDRWGQLRYELAQLRFRGVISEIRKLWEYLDANNKTDYLCTAIDNRIAELATDDVINFCYRDGTPFYLQVIQEFPALKVTGLVEDFNACMVIAFYSDSGAAYITDTQYCSPFDGKDDGLNGRWAHNIDMMKAYRDEYIDTRTSHCVIVNYRFPWEKEWTDQA